MALAGESKPRAQDDDMIKHLYTVSLESCAETRREGAHPLANNCVIEGAVLMHAHLHCAQGKTPIETSNEARTVSHGAARQHQRGHSWSLLRANRRSDRVTRKARDAQTWSSGRKNCRRPYLAALAATRFALHRGRCNSPHKTHMPVKSSWYGRSAISGRCPPYARRS